MNCHRVQSIISAYVDCELPGMEMLAVRQHLSTCTECRTEFDSTLRLKRAFGRLATPCPQDDLAVRICAQLQIHTAQVHEPFWQAIQQKFTLFPRTMKLAGVAASLIALSLIASHSGTNSESYIYTPISSTVAVGAVADHDANHLFAIAPSMQAASYRTNTKPAFEPNWTPFHSTSGSMTMVNFGGFGVSH